MYIYKHTNGSRHVASRAHAAAAAVAVVVVVVVKVVVKVVVEVVVEVVIGAKRKISRKKNKKKKTPGELTVNGYHRSCSVLQSFLRLLLRLLWLMGVVVVVLVELAVTSGEEINNDTRDSLRVTTLKF
jgi:hypothetical protein